MVLHKVAQGPAQPGFAIRSQRPGLHKRCLYAMQMARREVPLAHFRRLGLDSAAIPEAMWASGVEWTAWGWVYRARRLALQLDLAKLSVFRVPAGDGRHQGLGVGVSRIVEQLGSGRRLHDVAKVHHHDSVAHVMYHV